MPLLRSQLRKTAWRSPRRTKRGVGKPTFRVRNRFRDLRHAGIITAPDAGCGASVVGNSRCVAVDPGRYFVPPYVGVRGWIGIHLDEGPNWAEVGTLIEDSYRLVAPKRLLAELGEPGTAATAKPAKGGGRKSALPRGGRQP